MKPTLFRAFALLVAVLALGGCATGYKLDNQVQSFSTLAAVPAQPTYRFERLPSQQAQPAQAEVEALADAALHQAGLRRDDSQPRYGVQVSARVDRVLSPWADPWDPWGWGWGVGWGLGGPGFGLWGGLPRMEQPWYQREVAVVVRELASNQVVFESRAQNRGPLLDHRAVLPAMFQAALHGFPNPPTGVRQVDIQIGGTPPAR